MTYIRVMKSKRNRFLDKVKKVLLAREFTASVLAFSTMVGIFVYTFWTGDEALEAVFWAILGLVFTWMGYMALTE